MTVTEIRRTLIEVLRDAGVSFLGDAKLENAFIDGRFDVNLDQLEVDSLAAMEICIALEANWGMAIVPEDLNRIGSIQALVCAVMTANLQTPMVQDIDESEPALVNVESLSN
jgi:acyl carrier protein